MKNIDNIINKMNFKKRGLNISVDVDNVLFRIPIIEHLNQVFGEKYTYSDFKDWEGTGFPEHVRNEMYAAFKSSEFMCKTKSYWGNYSKLRDWKAEGHKIFAISRRAPHLIEKTWMQMDREYPGIFTYLYCVAPNESKLKYLHAINADVHIDDWDVLDSVNAGINTWLITNEETCYNHPLRENVNLRQAYSLQHVKLGKEEEKWLK